ncbi:intein-containing replicative DNA helicase, partial [Candidatus Peregrinibacteria bacterium]|nr:intein-containing replicative DNA helicase [Candidatus Peregrinibacteria bacterium]
TGRLSDDDFSKIGAVMDDLNSMKIYIDDSIGNSIAELKAKARRLKMESGLDFLVIDYLQLMSSGTFFGQANRVQEISEISRALKSLARDLSITILALSQLSRAVEMRPSKIPQLSDLRECVTGDTRVLLADGSMVEVRKLEGKTPEVLSVDEKGGFVKALAETVWKVGEKPVYAVKLASGRVIRATENHRLLADFDWCEIGKLKVGDRIAITHKIPEPENSVRWPDLRVALLGQLIGDGSYLNHQPMRYTTASEENSQIVKEACEAEFGCEVKRYKGRRTWHQLLISGNGNRWKPAGVNKWLRDLGIFGQRSHQKQLPEAVFRFSNEQVALLLRHLWATDGTIFTRKAGSKGSHRIHYSTNSPKLAGDVSALLLRFGIVARIEKVRKGNYHPNHMIVVTGAADQRKFLKYVGTFGPKKESAAKLEKALKGVIADTNVDTFPEKIFEKIQYLMQVKGISQRQMALLRGTEYGGASHFAFAPSRIVVKDYAQILQSEELESYCNNDLFWDKVVNISYDGVEEVFDLSVPDTSCWIAENVVSHNSGAIEQDADVVLMMYREDYYEEDIESGKKGVTDLFIRKHRNGPIGHVEMAFKKEQMKFLDIEKNRKIEDYAKAY